MIAPAALSATFAFSCGDDESVLGPTGGSGGAGANGGSAGIGGSGGNGGSNVAGAAGSGGSAGAGAGAGGTAGTAGMAGSAGTAGTAGVGNDPDAGDGGTDSDSGTVQLTPQQQTAQTICDRMDAIDSCQAPAATCREDQISLWENDFKGSIDTSISGCDGSIVDAYFNCLATDSTAAYDCLGGSGDAPEVADQTGTGCEDEQNAMYACFP